MAVNLLFVGVLFLELEIGLFTQMAAATYRYPKRKKKGNALHPNVGWDGYLLYVGKTGVDFPAGERRASRHCQAEAACCLWPLASNVPATTVVVN